MVSWLIVLSGHCSWVNNVIISVANYALIMMADIKNQTLGRCGILSDTPACVSTWLLNPKMGANGRVS